MDDERDNAKPPRPGQSEYVEMIAGEESFAIGPPPPPITREDLLRVFEKDYSAEDAAQLASDLTPVRPGGFWSKNILLGVAALSPEHALRMREYLGWSAEHMAAELEKSRAS